MTVLVEWGLGGAQRYGGSGGHFGATVVVDVLSFTTCVSVAADLDVEVLPYRWADASAATFAEARGAVLAVPRAEAGPGQVSLSPASLRGLGPEVRRVVLPSPNGSTICDALGERGGSGGRGGGGAGGRGGGGAGGVVLAGCLRNRTAMASYLAGVLRDAPDCDVLVVSAGERWPDDSLRPALEDWWGAGAVVAALADQLGDLVGDVVPLSEEAAAAAASYRAVCGRLPDALRGVASGQELTGMGFADDVAVAAEVDQSDVVPVLVDGAFVPG